MDFPHFGIRVTAIGKGELLCIESPECRGPVHRPRDVDVLLLIQFSDNAPVSRDKFIQGLTTILAAPCDEVNESG